MKFVVLGNESCLDTLLKYGQMSFQGLFHPNEVYYVVETSYSSE